MQSTCRAGTGAQGVHQNNVLVLVKKELLKQKMKISGSAALPDRTAETCVKWKLTNEFTR